MSDTQLPLFVYGTLLPGEPNHDRFLRGRTCQERPAVLPGALLYEGPGYPYAVEGHGTVHGALVTAAPGAYAELLGLLDDLEEFLGPGHPRNLYERVAREAVPAPGVPDEPRPGDSGAGEPDAGQPGAGQPGAGQPGPGEPGPVRAWVYLAAGAVARSLRTGGTPVPGGDWLSRRPPPARRTP
ncbi:gamma-glutamylcyclotransferase [Streptomyces sp. ME02-6979-3A]|uniref:Gamma-glutamylcyclotransferase n=1 Tax=Streptomyces silvae TaxID=2803812 RepID=A0ABU8A1H5_9ACTN|nr:gamma-glutamylcyclotransferase [Streptomyces sp. ME02-6979-3A]MDX3328964.1 gamma-glutamylcyclotransferase [Streptomyces sp. ME02-6979-3A]